jgi:DNA repair exonuclease SbcCD ATPase subunit
MGRLTINKLILLGPRYKRTLEFKDGLNIISGDRTSGKSLVLNLIDYCLGRSEKIELNVQKELDKYCDEVFLELKINNETLTFKRLLKQKQSKIAIYFCAFNVIDGYIPKTVDIKEAMHFIMRKLNINEYKRIKYKAHSTQQELETISFRDIFRYVYVKQHALGTDDFLENKAVFKRNKNPYAFEMIFNLTEPDKNQLKEELVNAKNSIDKINKEIAGLTSYLKDKDAEDFSQLMSKVANIDKQILEKKNQKEEIIKKSRENGNIENQMYIKLKNRLTEITNQIFDYQKQKKELQTSLNAKKLLRKEYEIEKSEIEATIEINYKLVVPEQSIECPLCHSVVASQIKEDNKQQEKILHKVQKEIVNKIGSSPFSVISTQS